MVKILGHAKITLPLSHGHKRGLKYLISYLATLQGKGQWDQDR